MLKKLACGLLAAFCLTACSDDDDKQPSIVGTWEWDTENQAPTMGGGLRIQTLAFFADGTAAIETYSAEDHALTYGYYDYRVDNGRFRITDHFDNSLLLNGAYAINKDILTLNNYQYIRQQEQNTSGWSEKVLGSWKNDEQLDNRHVTSLLAFLKGGEGSLTTVTSYNDQSVGPVTNSETFRYWVKRNYLIQEYDAGYVIATLSFGLQGKSLIIDGRRYTQL